jgi:hypothetical protein
MSKELIIPIETLNKSMSKELMIPFDPFKKLCLKIPIETFKILTT